MTNSQAVIWDVDGTLVDTAELHFQAWMRLAQERGLPFSRADFHATFGRRNPEILRLLFGDQLSDVEVAELGDHKETLYREAARQGVELLPGVRPLLEGLRQEGWRQAIGSSAPRANLDLILELTGVADYFAAVVAMEDTQRGKPDPQVFQLAARKLTLAPAHCLVIEDAVAGVEAAKAAGMTCIAVTFVGHHPAASLRQAGADLVVPNLEEVDAARVRELLRQGIGLSR
ncbi:MAG: HAD family hydrolase [Gemmataceae bacterium]